jgi:hypothetical protein
MLMQPEGDTGRDEFSMAAASSTLPDRVSEQDGSAVREIGENKPKWVTRSFVAVATLQSYFPGLLVSLIITLGRDLFVRAQWRTGDAVRALARHGWPSIFLSQEGSCVAGIESQRVVRVRNVTADG